MRFFAEQMLSLAETLGGIEAAAPEVPENPERREYPGDWWHR